MKPKIFIIVCLLLQPLFVYSQSGSADSMTLSTYYPSPRGVYKDVEVSNSVIFKPVTDLSAISDPEEGQMVYVHNADKQGFYFYDGTDWLPVSSQEEVKLFGMGHTEAQCIEAGGEVVPVPGSEYNQCRFSGSACPIDWTKLHEWSTTTSETLLIAGCTGICDSMCTCSTGGHAWANKAQEKCTAAAYQQVGPHGCERISSPKTKYANIIQVGCW